jgi:hypothetical protein
VTLNQEDIAVIGQLLAEEREATLQGIAELLQEAQLAQSARSELMDTAELAAYLKVDRKFIERHRAKLGGVPLGETGRDRKPRWRFDRDGALAAYKGLTALPTSPSVPSANKRRRRRIRSGGVRFLPVKGER